MRSGLFSCWFAWKDEARRKQGAAGEVIYTASLLHRLAFPQHMAQPLKANICLSLIYARVGRALSMHIDSSAVPNETFLPCCLEGAGAAGSAPLPGSKSSPNFETESLLPATLLQLRGTSRGLVFWGDLGTRCWFPV